MQKAYVTYIFPKFFSKRKALNDYLHKNIPYSNDTMWVDIINRWNIFNSSHMIDPHKNSQPDYTTIREPKK